MVIARNKDVEEKNGIQAPLDKITRSRLLPDLPRLRTHYNLQSTGKTIVIFIGLHQVEIGVNEMP